ncbi:hypothetical protein Tco_1435913, partial [Tanacetum coccineum]
MFVLHRLLENNGMRRGFHKVAKLEDAVSTISQEYLLEFTSKYGIPESLHLELPGLEDTIMDFPEGKNREPLSEDILEATTQRDTGRYYPKRYWELLPKEILGAITQRETGMSYGKME